MATVTRKVFGVCKGKDVHEYTLTNANGTAASVITYGAILRTLLVNGKDDGIRSAAQPVLATRLRAPT